MVGIKYLVDHSFVSKAEVTYSCDVISPRGGGHPNGWITQKAKFGAWRRIFHRPKGWVWVRWVRGCELHLSWALCFGLIGYQWTESPQRLPWSSNPLSIQTGGLRYGCCILFLTLGCWVSAGTLCVAKTQCITGLWSPIAGQPLLREEEFSDFHDCLMRRSWWDIYLINLARGY